MTEPTSLQRLQLLLRDLFQLDLADLDFGLYRLLRLKRDEVEAFLTEQLPRRVREAFAEAGGQERVALEREAGESAGRLRAALGAGAIAPDGTVAPAFADTPLGREYAVHRARLAAVAADETRHGEVFDHLYDFFARYYEDGDFISRRYYGARERYAVPYNGDEVFFHWANRDQHYVKTGEVFRDYAFTVDCGMEGEQRVRFRLGHANIPAGNVKGDARFFYPLAEVDWDAARRALTIPFEYRPPTAEEQERVGSNGRAKQEQILDEALPRLLDAVPEPGLAAALRVPIAREGGDPEPLLRRRLRHFARRNTTDYFVHRNLRGFLEGELEFYLKDQVLHLGDLDGDLPARLRVIRTVRRLAGEVITFLVQLEEVQRRLFEKRKLVLRTDWLVLMKDVPKLLWRGVAGNAAQLSAWRTLFGIESEREIISVEGAVNEGFLEEHPTLVVDTRHFDAEFVDQLLEGFEGDLDEATGGVLIHSENYQALRLMEPTYTGRVKCIYIDPPYNTGNDGFAYKDSYQHSTWLAMLSERLGLARGLLSADGLLLSSIDDIEQPRLRLLMDTELGAGNRIANMVWKGATDNNPTRIATEHEYIVWYARDIALSDSEWKAAISDSKDLMLKKWEELRASGDSLAEIQGRFRRFVKNNRESFEPLTHYDRVDEEGPYTGGRKVHNPGKEGYRYDVIHPRTGKPCVQPARGYRFPPETMKKLIDAGKVLFGADENQIIQIKEYLRDYSGGLKGLLELDSRVGANTLEALFGSRVVFRNPKPVELLANLFSFVTASTEAVLDFFAGSGTTGQAIIDLNRKDRGKRRFVLVDGAEYFDTVLVPRIEKVLFTPEWKDGNPVRQATPDEVAGTPSLVKILRLESYEDALHNLSTEGALGRVAGRANAQRAVVGADAYRLRYLARLPLDGSASLLQLDHLAHPFRYTIEVLTDEGPREQPVDLIETFNLLYGLHVERRERWRNPADPDRIYRVVRGRRSDGRQVLVIWRDVEGLDPAVERGWLESRITGVDEALCNADSATPGLRSLDPDFKRLVAEPDSR